MTFTEHIERISYLCDQTLIHMQAEKFDSARDDLNSISLFAKEAMQQLYELARMKHQGKEPSKRLEG